MKIEVWFIGRPQQSYIDEGIKMYTNRIKHYAKFDVIQFDRIKNGHKLSKSELLKKEAAVIKNALKFQDYLILMDEKGKSFSSVSFADWINKLLLQNPKRIVFVIGGVYGFDNSIRTMANSLISLSNMTLPHEMARLILLEQLYRGFTIMKNESYHNP